jgi:hypothetical protein
MSSDRFSSEAAFQEILSSYTVFRDGRGGAKSKKLSPTFKKLLDSACELGLRSRHIAARPGPLEVPMIATLIPNRHRLAALRSRLCRFRPCFPLFTLLILFPAIAVAQSPFDTGFTAMQTLFTGTIAKVASLIAIVVGGYQFAHGEPGAKKVPISSCPRP